MLILSYTMWELEGMTDQDYLKHRERMDNLSQPQLVYVYGSTIVCRVRSAQFHENGLWYHVYIGLPDIKGYMRSHKLSVGDAVRELAAVGDVKVASDCPDWHYWGTKYYATRDKYAYGGWKTLLKPRRNNVQGKMRSCKHTSKVFEWIADNLDYLAEKFEAYYAKLMAKKNPTTAFVADTPTDGVSVLLTEEPVTADEEVLVDVPALVDDVVVDEAASRSEDGASVDVDSTLAEDLLDEDEE